MSNIIKLLVIFLAFVFLIFCSGKNEGNDGRDSNAKSVEFNLTGNDQMKFNLTEMVVREGSLVKISFENIGKMAKNIMGHNFVLLKSGVNLSKFAAKAMVAKDSEYIPLDEKDKIIVFSKLLGPGEKTIIEFEAPAEGTYKYICSFPGHYTLMQGDLIVTK